MSNVKYHNQEYSLEFDEYHTPLLLSLWANDLFSQEYERLTGVDVSTFFMIRDDHNVGYMQADSSRIIYNSLKNKLNREWADKERARFNYSVHELEALVEKMRVLPDDSSIEDLARDFKTLFDLTARIFPYSNSGYMLSFTLEVEIIKKLETVMSKAEAHELLVKACTPVEPSLLVKYRADIKNIIAQISELQLATCLEDLVRLWKQNEHFSRLMQNLQKRYFFLTALNAGERTVESMFPDILSEIQNPIVEEDLEIPEIVQDEIYVMKNIAYFKDECSTYLIPYFCFSLRKQWDRLAEAIGLTYYDIHQLMPYEIFELMDKPRDVQFLIKQRHRASLIIHEAHKPLKVEAGEQAEDTYAAMQAAVPAVEHKDISEFKGKVGCSGIGKGPVQIIRTSSEIKNFKEGNVLVAVYTAPEFVPAMQKAVAIVTDTGGITSHAAIVSRELRTPCVVGTKVATHVLKDGDLVEVDANLGIVRILQA